jgi:hypothetical protein
MLGFEVRFKDQIIHATIGDDGVLPVIFDYCNNCIRPEGNGTHLSVGGLASFEHLRWFYGNMDDVEQVIIKVIEVEQCSEFYSCPQDREDMIQTYLSLKKELQEEGLI